MAVARDHNAHATLAPPCGHAPTRRFEVAVVSSLGLERAQSGPAATPRGTRGCGSPAQVMWSPKRVIASATLVSVPWWSSIEGRSASAMYSASGTPGERASTCAYSGCAAPSRRALHARPALCASRPSIHADRASWRHPRVLSVLWRRPLPQGHCALRPEGAAQRSMGRAQARTDDTTAPTSPAARSSLARRRQDVSGHSRRYRCCTSVDESLRRESRRPRFRVRVRDGHDERPAVVRPADGRLTPWLHPAAPPTLPLQGKRCARMRATPSANAKHLPRARLVERQHRRRRFEEGVAAFAYTGGSRPRVREERRALANQPVSSSAPSRWRGCRYRKHAPGPPRRYLYEPPTAKSTSSAVTSTGNTPSEW